MPNRLKNNLKPTPKNNCKVWDPTWAPQSLGFKGRPQPPKTVGKILFSENLLRKKDAGRPCNHSDGSFAPSTLLCVKEQSILFFASFPIRLNRLRSKFPAKPAMRALPKMFRKNKANRLVIPAIYSLKIKKRDQKPAKPARRVHHYV